MIFEEKSIFKKQISKKNCTQKLTLWFSLHRKKRKLCVLRAFLKNTILMKKNSKKHDFECKIFSKKHDFEWKSFFKKHDFEFFVLSDFEKKNFVLSDFELIFFSSRQILNQLLYNASVFISTFVQRACFWTKNLSPSHVLFTALSSI